MLLSVVGALALLLRVWRRRAEGNPCAATLGLVGPCRQGAAMQIVRFIVTYRWELWVLLWTPLLTGILAAVALTLLVSIPEDRGWAYPRYFFHATGAVGGLLSAGLLLVFYARVRRLRRRFLTLVWGYAIGLAAVGALVWLVAAALVWDEQGLGQFDLAVWMRGTRLAHGVVALLPLFWFARQASQLSTAHAYFLFVVVKSYSLAAGLVTALNLLLLGTIPVGLLFAIGFASVLGSGFVFAWLLGNFDDRGIVFQRQVVGWLLAAHAVSVVWGLHGATVLQDRMAFAQLLVALILPVVLIYLVRVRHAVSAPQPPADLQA